ncbi:hypothetical protein B0H19DRAFT_1073382 [Mycena capillaripes]|nr:hypothetical protein B0H19DRAFT_1073382 [Mycena capillaripes]
MALRRRQPPKNGLRVDTERRKTTFTAPLSQRFNMVQLLSNLTAVATAASLLRIVDHKRLFGLDVASALCTDLTPVQAYQAAAVSNQEILVSNCNKYLTYPGTVTGALPIRSQPAIRSVASSSWIIALVDPTIPTGAWNIIEANSNLALTVWGSDPVTNSLGNPITFEELNPNDTRQMFWFVAGDLYREVAEIIIAPLEKNISITSMRPQKVRTSKRIKSNISARPTEIAY